MPILVSVHAEAKMILGDDFLFLRVIVSNQFLLFLMALIRVSQTTRNR